MRLTWNELLIQDISQEQFRSWIAPWEGVIHGQVAPAFMNKFGSWFLRRPAGHVELFDVLTGQLETIASTYDSFIREVNEPWWQEMFLHSELIYRLHQAGKIPGLEQCYAIAPHPILGGPNPTNGEPVDLKNVMCMDIVVWQSLCAQFLNGTSTG